MSCGKNGHLGGASCIIEMCVGGLLGVALTDLRKGRGMQEVVIALL